MRSHSTTAFTVWACEESRESFQNIISSVEIDEQHKSMTTSNS